MNIMSEAALFSLCNTEIQCLHHVLPPLGGDLCTVIEILQGLEGTSCFILVLPTPPLFFFLLMVPEQGLQQNEVVPLSFPGCVWTRGSSTQ